MSKSETPVLTADEGAIARAAELLRRGGLVAFPTETVYGLGVHALDHQAVQRLFVAKGRPATDPLIVHVGSLEAAAPLLAGIPDTAWLLASRFWPGPLTLVMARSSMVPDDVTAALDTVAIRVPAHPVARALIAAARLPIAAPSANLFSRPSPTRASHVIDDLDGRIDLVLDGGPTTVGVESTVLDLSTATPTILRPGAITAAMLRAVLPIVATRSGGGDAEGSSQKSPGLLEKHYSPRAPLTLYEGARAVETMVSDAGAALRAGRRVGILAAADDRESLAVVGDARIVMVGPASDLEGVAANLYAGLRQLDAENLNVILARAFSAAEGLGLAIQNRLRRAASGRIIRTS